MKLFDLANQYCKESTWKTIALLKFCLLSLGVIIGMWIPDAYRTVVLVVFGIIFIATYVPLMAKLYRIWRRSK